MKGKNKALKSYELDSVNGVRDLELGKASYDAKMRRDFSKDGRASKPSSKKYADVSARDARWAKLFTA